MSEPFHPLVVELAESLDDELNLAEKEAAAWITRLSMHPDGESIAVHLAVLAMRLNKSGAPQAAAQLVYVAQMAFNNAAAATVATAAGMKVDQAKKLTGWKKEPGPAKGLVGLAAPSGGVGPRTKK
ncbi:MAG: hypothetical protein H7Z43_14670 [Clostridia bacterium]|nr:hypothetical protein [Deltaproteobacteria bacterium]